MDTDPKRTQLQTALVRLEYAICDFGHEQGGIDHLDDLDLLIEDLLYASHKVQLYLFS